MHGSRLLFASVIVVIVLSVGEGLRGCSKFGHSCFGAHGKRSGPEEISGKLGGLSLYNIEEGKKEDDVPRIYEEQMKEINPSRSKNAFIRKWVSTLKRRETDSNEP